MRTIDTEKDKKFVDIVYKYEPIGLGFGELQRKTGLRDMSTQRWVSGVKYDWLYYCEFYYNS